MLMTMKTAEMRMARLGRGCLVPLVMLVGVLLAGPVQAGTVTAASGGDNISADTAASGGTGAWTTIVGPIYAETVNGDLDNGTVILTAPSGFEFNAAPQ